MVEMTKIKWFHHVNTVDPHNSMCRRKPTNGVRCMQVQDISSFCYVCLLIVRQQLCILQNG
jgi:hypothetical protein